MTMGQFETICAKHNIHPAMALEVEGIQELLANGGTIAEVDQRLTDNL